MRRRQVLAGVTAGLLPFTAGCLGGNNDAVECPGADDGGPEIIDETDGDDNENDEGVVLSFTSLDEPPDPLCVEFVVVNDQLTQSEMPLVDITVWNLGSESVTWSQTSTDYAFPTRETTEQVLTIGAEDERGVN